MSRFPVPLNRLVILSDVRASGFRAFHLQFRLWMFLCNVFVEALAVLEGLPTAGTLAIWYRALKFPSALVSWVALGFRQMEFPGPACTKSFGRVAARAFRIHTSQPERIRIFVLLKREKYVTVTKLAFDVPCECEM